MNCDWCSSDETARQTASVFWELPDGTKGIEIRETPCIVCSGCGMVYHEEKIIEEIEDQLFLIDTKKLEKSLTFEELMAKPRFLKRNYFKFD
ncbi:MULTISPECIES: YokU family protein [Bacillaceae]|uniref:YokU family protein n=2 Tax=Bacillus infantis TaxID=324767 RepID=U5LCD8_9BACI|nr:MULTISPECIES: YokU family protein [Bacillus]OXT19460.1 YokU family protein [Bacillus sp. OG2]AGX05125.1 hypothetical protein N288_16180 [Bacillus infantis NRRL B-14911]EAR66431.1 hypothetical protein B14911_22787 [Bacillus sp. NRRL B-14911]MCA1036992.1 YokU family protein [Bacillus infantis]MCK6204793.1 YokU family protein [Bacillus infantis]